MIEERAGIVIGALTLILSVPLAIVGIADVLRAEDSPTPAPQAVYQVSDAERLQLSQLESQIWRARYAVEMAQQALGNALGALSANCEASGGQFDSDPNQPTSSTCVPRQGRTEESPASATPPQETEGPEAQEENP